MTPCPAKVRYSTYKRAVKGRAQVVNHFKRPYWIYPCRQCGAWHLTTQEQRQ